MKTKIASAFVLIITATAFVSPVLAGTAAMRASQTQAAKQHATRASTKPDRNAYGMYAGSGGRLDPNSPAATGGGSLGYNQTLLQMW